MFGLKKKSKTAYRKTVTLILACTLGLTFMAACNNSNFEQEGDTAMKESEKTTEKNQIETDEQTTNSTDKGPLRNVNVITENATDNITYSPLALGQVKATSWLKNQLLLQAEQMTSIFESISPDCKSDGEDRSGWLGGSGESWERGTYFVRGLVATAYVLDDSDLKNQAQKWIDWTLASQNESGAFGPYADSPDKLDYWPLMPMLIALEYYYNATDDGRVLDFLEKYFAWEYEVLQKKPLTDWGQARGGDNILAVWWLYEKTKDSKLLDLCQLLYKQTYNWEAAYDKNAWSETYHIVNVQESFKLFPLMYALTGNKEYLNTYYKGIENLYITSGRQDGMSNGDEILRGVYSTYGSETCAVVERMLCDEIALYLLRDAKIADHLEDIAYNAFPQQLLPNGRGQVYFTMQNQVMANLGAHGFTSDGGDRSVYGMPGGYPCCAHNYQMGWPLFIASQWMKTSDNGIAAGAYGPCEVNATVGNDTHVTITETTNYPYEGTVQFKISSGKSDTYPIYLRVPSWCTQQATITVNGHSVDCSPEAGKYFALVAEWHGGDIITIDFPMSVSYAVTENNSISIKYGGVLMALEIKEKWRALNYNPLNWNLPQGYTSFNITPSSEWAMALTDINLSDIGKSFSFIQYEINDTMQYRLNDVPFALETTAQNVENWKLNSINNTSGVLPVSPVSDSELTGDTVKVRLVPYAFTRLRITLMPWSSSSPNDTVYQTLPDESQNNESSLTFSSVPGIHVDSKQIHTQILTLHYSTQKDIELKILINRKDCGSITLHAGSGTLDIKNDAFRGDYHNLVELKTADSSPMPENIKISLSASAENLGYIRYEAEDAKLTGSAYKSGDHVAGIDDIGSSLTFSNIKTEQDGVYHMRLYYAAPLGLATHTLYVDGQKVATVKYNDNGKSLGWGCFASDIYAEIELNLNAGVHEVVIIKTDSDTGFAELDGFDLIPD